MGLPLGFLNHSAAASGVANTSDDRDGQQRERGDRQMRLCVDQGTGLRARRARPCHVRLCVTHYHSSGFWTEVVTRLDPRICGSIPSSVHTKGEPGVLSIAKNASPEITLAVSNYSQRASIFHIGPYLAPSERRRPGPAVLRIVGRAHFLAIYSDRASNLLMYPRFRQKIR